MYPLVAANNWGAAAFMLAWLVVGYFVILTLFMAIIMEAFESKYHADSTEEAFTACESCETCHSPAFVTHCYEVHVPAAMLAQNQARTYTRSVPARTAAQAMPCVHPVHKANHSRRYCRQTPKHAAFRVTGMLHQCTLQTGRARAGSCFRRPASETLQV